MTIIAAAIDRPSGRWAIGCDTGVSNSGTAWEVKTKIVRVGPALIGWAGNAGVARYLAEFVWESRDSDRECGRLVEYLAERCKTPENGCALLVVDPASLRMWTLCSGDASVVEPAGEYVAIGSGAAVAMGAMFARPDAWPAPRVEVAIDACLARADGCFGRAVVEHGVRG